MHKAKEPLSRKTLVTVWPLVTLAALQNPVPKLGASVEDNLDLRGRERGTSHNHSPLLATWAIKRFVRSLIPVGDRLTCIATRSLVCTLTTDSKTRPTTCIAIVVEVSRLMTLADSQRT